MIFWHVPSENNENVLFFLQVNLLVVTRHIKQRMPIFSLLWYSLHCYFVLVLQLNLVTSHVIVIVQITMNIFDKDFGTTDVLLIW